MGMAYGKAVAALARAFVDERAPRGGLSARALACAMGAAWRRWRATAWRHSKRWHPDGWEEHCATAEGRASTRWRSTPPPTTPTCATSSPTRTSRRVGGQLARRRCRGLHRGAAARSRDRGRRGDRRPVLGSQSHRHRLRGRGAPPPGGGPADLEHHLRRRAVAHRHERPRAVRGHHQHQDPWRARRHPLPLAAAAPRRSPARAAPRRPRPSARRRAPPRTPTGSPMPARRRGHGVHRHARDLAPGDGADRAHQPLPGCGQPGRSRPSRRPARRARPPRACRRRHRRAAPRRWTPCARCSPTARTASTRSTADPRTTRSPPPMPA